MWCQRFFFVKASDPNDTQGSNGIGTYPLHIRCIPTYGMLAWNDSFTGGFTFLCTRVSGETVRPRHDLSHPARTKKQIDASSHYNSLPPLPSLRRAMQYPPGIARQIKHHLLSERVDLDLTGRVRRRSGRKGVRASSPNVSLFQDNRARFNGERKFVAAKDPAGFSWITRPRVTVCARAILHTIARTGSKSAVDLCTHLRLPRILTMSACNLSSN